MVIIQLIINKTYRNKYHEKQLKNKGHLRDIKRQQYTYLNAQNIL